MTTTNHDDELTTVVTGSKPHPGYRIPTPAEVAAQQATERPATTTVNVVRWPVTLNGQLIAGGNTLELAQQAAIQQSNCFPGEVVELSDPNGTVVMRYLDGARQIQDDEHPDQVLANKQAAGLRALADMIEAHPELAPDVDYTLRHGLLGMPLQNHQVTDQRARLAEWARFAKQHGAKVTKDVGDGTFKVLADRNEVCERVVTGTETVTRKVPDPNAAVPLVEVTETVEKVEWVCKPLLDSEAVSR